VRNHVVSEDLLRISLVVAKQLYLFHSGHPLAFLCKIFFFSLLIFRPDLVYPSFPFEYLVMFIHSLP